MRILTAPQHECPVVRQRWEEKSENSKIKYYIIIRSHPTWDRFRTFSVPNYIMMLNRYSLGIIITINCYYHTVTRGTGVRYNKH